jgi:hypothetical protein
MIRLPLTHVNTAILDPQNASINLQTIIKATSILGKKLKIEFI